VGYHQGPRICTPLPPMISVAAISTAPARAATAARALAAPAETQLGASVASSGRQATGMAWSTPPRASPWELENPPRSCASRAMGDRAAPVVQHVGNLTKSPDMEPN